MLIIVFQLLWRKMDPMTNTRVPRTDTLKKFFVHFHVLMRKTKYAPFLWSIRGKYRLYFLYDNPAFKKCCFRTPSLKWLFFYNQHLNSALNYWNKVITSHCASCQRAFSSSGSCSSCSSSSIHISDGITLWRTLHEHYSVSLQTAMERHSKRTYVYVV